MCNDSRTMAANPGEPGGATPSAIEIYEMIREAAYYRAEKRGFAPGLDADDWVQAEAEVMAGIRTGNPGRP